MEILPLSAVPQHAEQLTEWLWRAFGAAESRDFFASIIASSLKEAEFPVTFVATEQGKLLGTVGFWRCDLISRQDLFPWLAALYVDENARGKGVSEALQRHVIDYAQQRGYPQLWLWSTFTGYYERFGWTPQGEALEYPDIPVRLYSRLL
ncbi:GNAT family N-acetyltransferase [Pantoea sp. LMR881]|uniref:GNAT family N-acetyltransferase n=1 Tax=Pantoea sp. LMR881 TaxID=3014336 RepID=UPI0022AF1A40|nr:GNAT family N-acetyltransferase [Pantoea sp. LMR881]MCZ4060311.1 GNAT family N-acetyltransferase [Pantoea sp. LMR881]